MTGMRPPAVAGLFYTAHPKILSLEVDKFLEKAGTPVLGGEGTVVGLIVPHAGYTYSGLTAAHAYATIRKSSISTVVIISPSHREYFEGISVYSGHGYRTPLGDVYVDEKLRDEIAAGSEFIEVSEQGHGAEHAVEVQLPFLQKVLREFMILPLVMGEQSRKFCTHLGNRLSEVLKGRPETLIVATSDLSHYHRHEEAEKLDSVAISDISSFDYERLMTDLESERTEACGGGPIVAALTALKKSGASRTQVLHHSNSGDTTGDRSAVVGYLSAAIIREN